MARFAIIAVKQFPPRLKKKKANREQGKNRRGEEDDSITYVFVVCIKERFLVQASKEKEKSQLVERHGSPKNTI